MWKKTLWSLLSVLVSLIGFYGVVRLGWTVEVLVAAALVAAFLVIGLLSGNEGGRRVAASRDVALAVAVTQAAVLPELLDSDDGSDAVTVETPMVTPIRNARTFEWGAVPEAGASGPSQF